MHRRWKGKWTMTDNIKPDGRRKRRYTDISGKRFKRLTAVLFSHTDRHRSSFWFFKCDCGTEKIIKASSVMQGNVKSCGCLHRETATHLCRNRTKHGLARSRLDNIYNGMVRRCYDQSAVNYERYGARDINVCAEWLADRGAFFGWALANGYEPDLELDREKNHFGYSPDNCRWVTSIVNQNNRRNNRILTAYGKSDTLSNWARTVGITPNLINNRIRKGVSVERALQAGRLQRVNS